MFCSTQSFFSAFCLARIGNVTFHLNEICKKNVLFSFLTSSTSCLTSCFLNDFWSTVTCQDLCWCAIYNKRIYNCSFEEPKKNFSPLFHCNIMICNIYSAHCFPLMSSNGRLHNNFNTILNYSFYFFSRVVIQWSYHQNFPFISTLHNRKFVTFPKHFHMPLLSVNFSFWHYSVILSLSCWLSLTCRSCCTELQWAQH